MEAVKNELVFLSLHFKKKSLWEITCNSTVCRSVSTSCVFHYMEIFYFVEIQSAFCLYLHTGLEYFNLILKLLISVSLKFETSVTVQIVNILCKSVSSLFISSYGLRIFQLNFDALIQVSIETSWLPYPENLKHL